LAATAWQARRAFAQARATAQQAARADAVQQFLVDLLGSARFGVINAEQRRATTVEQLLERAALHLRERPSPDPQVQEALLNVVAQLFEGLGVHARAVDLWRDLAQRLGGRTGSALQHARVQTALGDSLHHANDLAGARDAYRAALTTLETADDGDLAPARAHVQCKLGWEHYILGEAATGKRLIEAATSNDAWQRGDARLRGDVFRAIAWCAGSEGRLHEAEAALRSALDADATGRDTADMVAIGRRVDLARMTSRCFALRWRRSRRPGKPTIRWRGTSLFTSAACWQRRAARRREWR
jgi:tetratricopeptide (TPR) repeat protein